MKLIEFEPSTGSYSPSIEFFVPETDKARDLRAQVARILESFGQLPPEHVRLVLLRSDVAEVCGLFGVALCNLSLVHIFSFLGDFGRR